MISLAPCTASVVFLMTVPLWLSCSRPTEAVTELHDSNAKVGLDSWLEGALAQAKLETIQLRPLSLGLGGYPIWKSNNPEVIKGNGWLMHSAAKGGERGGRRHSLQGCTNVYVFHINKSGATRHIHLMANSANEATILFKGSLYTNGQKPLGQGTGQSYEVARDWLTGSFAQQNKVVLEQNAPVSVSSTVLAPGAMVDGRFEICSEHDFDLATVVTSTGSSQEATEGFYGPPAAGDIYTSTANTFGREAGVYAQSVHAGITLIEIPAEDSHMGFFFNTTNKFDARIQDQTVPALMTLGDSAPRTYGNYGHKFDVTLRLSNRHGSDRKLTLRFASNYGSQQNVPSFTWNGPVMVNEQIIDVYTTPTSPGSNLGSWILGAGKTLDLRLTLFVPGLITTNQQLILENLAAGS